MTSLFDATAPALDGPAAIFLDETGMEPYRADRGPRTEAVVRPYAIASRRKDGGTNLAVRLPQDVTEKAVELWGGTCDVLVNPVTLDLALVSGGSCSVSVSKNTTRGSVSISKLAETFKKARGDHRYYVYEGAWTMRADGGTAYAMRLAETREKL